MSLLLPATVRELRLLGSQSSVGLKAFIATSYLPTKQANPTLPILIREAQGVPARVFARFENGVEKVASLEDATTAKQVEERIATLCK